MAHGDPVVQAPCGRGLPLSPSGSVLIFHCPCPSPPTPPTPPCSVDSETVKKAAAMKEGELVTSARKPSPSPATSSPLPQVPSAGHVILQGGSPGQPMPQPSPNPICALSLHPCWQRLSQDHPLCRSQNWLATQPGSDVPGV